MQDIWKAARALLDKERFDQSDDESDLDMEEDSDNSSDTDEEEDTDSENSDNEFLKTIRKSLTAKKSVSSRKYSKEKKTKKQDNSKKGQAEKGNQDEVESLIERMGKLSLQDPQYSLLYYKAIKLDPVIATIVQKPLMLSETSNSCSANFNPVT